MEKEINEMTMEFAGEMYDFINESGKNIADFPVEFQAAAKAAIQMKKEFGVSEIAEICEKWQTANPGEYPYVRLFDAFGIRPEDQILNLGNEYDWPDDADDYRTKGPSARWLDDFIDEYVTVNLSAGDNEKLKKLYGEALNDLAERMSEDCYENVDWEKIAGEYFDEVDTDYDDEDDEDDEVRDENPDSWNNIFKRIIRGEDEDGDMECAFSEYMVRFNSRNYRYDDIIKHSVWVDIWAALGCQTTAYEFLTRYCEVKPLENEE